MLQRKWGGVVGEKTYLFFRMSEREELAQKKQVKLSPYKPGKNKRIKTKKRKNRKNKRQRKNLALP